MALVEARDHAVRVLARGGDLREVRKRTIRSLEHDGLAEWTGRETRLTAAGVERAEALEAESRAFWEGVVWVGER